MSKAGDKIAEGRNEAIAHEMTTQPTPDQLDRALTCAEQAQQKHGHKGGAVWATEAALTAILQSDQQQAERIAYLEGIVKRVQSAAKTIMIGEADELARLREEKRGEWLAAKTLDSEREMNAILTAENERLATQQAELKALVDAMAGALETILNGEYPRPVGKYWRADCEPTKHDRCVHEVWMYETCEGCLDAYVSEALTAFRDSQKGRSDG